MNLKSYHPSPSWRAGTLLLTGGTGFVGMELLARLLEETERRIHVLIRASSQHEAESRLRATLGTLFNDPARYAARVQAVAGDLTLPGLGLGGVRASLVAEVDEIIHAAASVSFGLSLEDARAVNVQGTRRMLDLAHECAHAGRLRRFTHVSTAFVCGTRRGSVLEAELDAGQSFRNSYEQSKLEAEKLVWANAKRLAATVVRPSIVVGDRSTGWTAAFNVIYTPLRALMAGALPVLPARGRARLDIVSVDYVAQGTLALAAHPHAAGRTFHLVAGEAAATVRELVTLAAARTGCGPPRLVVPWLYTKLGRHIIARASSFDSAGRLRSRSEMYFPYLSVAARFDDRQARELLDPIGVAPAPVSTYLDSLVEFARAARWGRHPIGRAQAQALAGLGPADVLHARHQRPAGLPQAAGSPNE